MKQESKTNLIVIKYTLEGRRVRQIEVTVILLKYWRTGPSWIGSRGDCESNLFRIGDKFLRTRVTIERTFPKIRCVYNHLWGVHSFLFRTGLDIGDIRHPLVRSVVANIQCHTNWVLLTSPVPAEDSVWQPRRTCFPQPQCGQFRDSAIANSSDGDSNFW